VEEVETTRPHKSIKFTVNLWTNDIKKSSRRNARAPDASSAEERSVRETFRTLAQPTVPGKESHSDARPGRGQSPIRTSFSRTSFVEEIIETVQESTETREERVFTQLDFVGHQNDCLGDAEPHQATNNRSRDRNRKECEARFAAEQDDER
jgi:hypothetical protein